MLDSASSRHRSSGAHRRSRSRSPPGRSHSRHSRENHRRSSTSTRTRAERRPSSSWRHRRSSPHERRTNRSSSSRKTDSVVEGPPSEPIDADCCGEIRRVVLVQKKRKVIEPELQQQSPPVSQEPVAPPAAAAPAAATPTPAAATPAAATPAAGPAALSGSQIRVSEATRRRIAEGAGSEWREASSAAPTSTSFGTFGRPPAATSEEAAAGAATVSEPVAKKSEGASSSGSCRTSSAKRSGSGRRCRSRSPSSSSGSGSDVSVRRGGGSSGGRLKIDKKRLRRKAIENTVLRLSERCPRRLAEMPCFKALGVKVSELERICRKLVAAEDKDSLDVVSKDSAEQRPAQSASVGMRHPFQLSESGRTAASSKSAAPSRFGESRTGQKQQLLATFPVSSGEFHRHSDQNGGVAEASTQQPLQSDAAPVTAASAAGIGINGSVVHEASTSRQQQQQPLSSTLSSAATDENKDRLLAIADWAASRPQAQMNQLLQQQLRSRSPQAWVKKHQLLNAQPIKGGIGHHLMQKMGWRDGQGLGKRNEGPTEPLAIDYKTDRKGLASLYDRPAAGKKKKSSALPAAATAAVVAANAAASTAAAASAAAVSGTSLGYLNGKHPICALLEAARRRRLPEPQFQLVQHSGPAHSPSFVFCVKIGSIEYQPTRPCGNKKDAKACAATFALQQLGLVPGR